MSVEEFVAEFRRRQSGVSVRLVGQHFSRWEVQVFRSTWTTLGTVALIDGNVSDFRANYGLADALVADQIVREGTDGRG